MNLSLKGIPLTPCTLRDRAMGRFECIPLRLPSQIRGAKDRIGVSDEYGIQRTPWHQKPMVESSDRRNGRRGRVGAAVEKEVRVWANGHRVYIELRIIGSSNRWSEVPIESKTFSREHFVGGRMRLPTGVGSSGTPSEVPTNDFQAAESILSGSPWDFRQESKVSIVDWKFRWAKRQPNKCELELIYEFRFWIELLVDM